MVRRRASDRGFALLLALAVLLLVAAAALLAFRTAVSTTSSLQRERLEIELRAAGDAALAETMAALDQAPGFSGQAPHPFGGATIGSSVRSRDDGTLDVMTVARLGGWEMTLSAVARIDPKGRVSILSWRRSTMRSSQGAATSVLP